MAATLLSDVVFLLHDLISSFTETVINSPVNHPLNCSLKSLCIHYFTRLHLMTSQILSYRFSTSARRNIAFWASSCYIVTIIILVHYTHFSITHLQKLLAEHGALPVFYYQYSFRQDKQRVVFQPSAAAPHLHSCPKFLDFARFCPFSRVRKYELTEPIISDHPVCSYYAAFRLCRIHIMPHSYDAAPEVWRWINPHNRFPQQQSSNP